jgi:hypothetical protein
LTLFILYTTTITTMTTINMDFGKIGDTSNEENITSLIYKRCLPWLNTKEIYLIPNGNYNSPQSIKLPELEQQEIREKLDKQTLFNIETIVQLIPKIKEYMIPRKYYNYKISSYGLKHIFERSMHTYCTNGEFILAMMIAGFIPKFSRSNSNIKTVNPYFKAKLKK